MLNYKTENTGFYKSFNLDDITDGIWEWNLVTDDSYYSPGWISTLEYDEQDIENTGEAWKKIIHPDDMDDVLNTLSMYLDKRIPKYEVRYRIKTKNHTYKWILGRGKAVWDTHGKPVHMVGTHTDITQYMGVEDALRESERKFRELFNNIDDPIFLIEITKEIMPGAFIEVNDKACSHLGYAREELLTMSLIDIRPSGSRDEIANNMAKLLTSRHAIFEALLVKKDDSLVNVEFNAHIYNLDGKEVILSIARDITDRKRHQSLMEESEQRYAKLIDLSPDAIIISDLNEILFCNRAALDMLGLNDKNELIGTHYINYIDPEYRGVINKLIKKLDKKRNYTQRGEIKLIRSDGSTVDIEVASTDLNYKDTRAMLSIVRDISERKKTEKKLMKIMAHNTKLLEETIEYDQLKTQFFSNISHELKTPLNIIFSGVQMMETSFCMEQSSVCKGKIDKYSSLLKQNCHRLLRLINNLIDISRFDAGYLSMNYKNYNIVSLVEDIVQSVAVFAGNKGIELIFDTESEEIIIASDADKIERIILNLLSNAIKFTEPEGKIEVTIKDVDHNVIISVRDSGIGIPKDKLPLIFERFRQVDSSLTRKKEGSGIGLSLVKTLVEAHGGRIYVNSEIHEGSEFIIELPMRLVDSNIESDAIETVSEVNVERINIEFSDIYEINYN